MKSRCALSLCAVLLASCISPGEPARKDASPTAEARARLRGSIPAVLMGLQSHVAIQRPGSHGDVWRQSLANTQKTIGETGPAVASHDVYGIGTATFLAANIAMPPLSLLTAGGTVSPARAENAVRRMESASPRRDWGKFVSKSIASQWAARGAPFSRVRHYDPSAAEAGPHPLSAEALAGVKAHTLLFVHVAGPSLSAESDRLNPRISPSLLLHWQVVDTRSGEVLARGTAAERSARRKTLLQWSKDDPAGLVPELERTIQAAAAALAAQLR